MVLAREHLTTYGPEHAAFVVRHALAAAKAVDFPMQTFGGTKNFLPQALAAWEGRAALSDKALAALRQHAEDALAADGVDRTCLGYEVLVKLKVDDLLKQEGVRMPVAAGRNP